MVTDQLRINLDAFNKMKGDLENDNMGRTALLHDGKIIDIYNDSFDAYTSGCTQYGLGNFSVETFGEKPKSLGFAWNGFHF